VPDVFVELLGLLFDRVWTVISAILAHLSHIALLKMRHQSGRHDFNSVPVRFSQFEHEPEPYCQCLSNHSVYTEGNASLPATIINLTTQAAESPPPQSQLPVWSLVVHIAGGHRLLCRFGARKQTWREG
jgi:hypothetical protein